MNCFITGLVIKFGIQIGLINISHWILFEDGKVTASYAASTGKVNLNVSEQQKLKRALNNTKYISIRENESIASLTKTYMINQ